MEWRALDVMATDLRDSLLAVSDDSRSSHRYQRIDGIHQVPSSSLASAMSKGKFNVDLDNPSAVYLPGQVVNGRVLLHLDTAETVRGELNNFKHFYDRQHAADSFDNVAAISVECVGKCEVQWSESESVGRDTRTVYYQASENYFQQSILLFGSSGEWTT